MVRQLSLATLSAAAVMFPLDYLWLRTMRPFYEDHMGGILLNEPRPAAAVLFYSLYAVGIAFSRSYRTSHWERSGQRPDTAQPSGSSRMAHTTRRTTPR